MKKALSALLAGVLVLSTVFTTLTFSSAENASNKTDYTDSIKMDLAHWDAGHYYKGITFADGNVTHNEGSWKTVYTLLEGLKPQTDYVLTFKLKNGSVLYTQDCQFIEKDDTLLFDHAETKAQFKNNGYIGSKTKLLSAGSVTESNGNVTVYFSTTAVNDYILMIAAGDCGTNPFVIGDFSLKVAEQDDPDDYTDHIVLNADRWDVGGKNEHQKLSFDTNRVSCTQSAWKAPYTTIEGLEPNTNYTLSFTYNSTCGDKDDSTQVTLYQGPHIVAKDNNLTGNVDSNGYKNKNAVISTYTSETGTFGNDDTKVTVKFTTTEETTYHFFISVGQCGNENSSVNCTFTASNFSLRVADRTDYTGNIKFNSSSWGVGGKGAAQTLTFGANSVSCTQAAWKAPYTTVNGLAPNTEYRLSFTYNSTCGDNDENTKIELYDKKAYVIAKDSNVAANLDSNGYKGQNPVLSTFASETGTFGTDDTKVTLTFTTTTETTYHLFISIGTCGNENPGIKNATFTAQNFSLKTAPKSDYSGNIKFTPASWDVGGKGQHQTLSFGTNSVSCTQAAWKAPYTTIEGLEPDTDYTLSFTYDSTCGDNDENTKIELYDKKAYVIAKDSNVADNLDSNGYKGQNPVLSTFASETGTFGTDDTKVTLTFSTGTETTYHLFISIGQCGNANPGINNATFTAQNFSLSVVEPAPVSDKFKLDLDHWDAGYYYEGITFDKNSVIHRNGSWKTVYTVLDGLEPNTEYIITFKLKGNSALYAQDCQFIEKDDALDFSHAQKKTDLFVNGGYRGTKTGLMNTSDVAQNGNLVTFYVKTTAATSYNLLISAGDCGQNQPFTISQFTLNKGKKPADTTEAGQWGIYSNTKWTSIDGTAPNASGWSSITNNTNSQYNYNGKQSIRINTNATTAARKLTNLEKEKSYKISFKVFVPSGTTVNPECGNSLFYSIGVVKKGTALLTGGGSYPITSYAAGPECVGQNGQWCSYEMTFTNWDETEKFFCLGCSYTAGYVCYLADFKCEETYLADPGPRPFEGWGDTPRSEYLINFDDFNMNFTQGRLKITEGPARNGQVSKTLKIVKGNYSETTFPNWTAVSQNKDPVLTLPVKESTYYEFSFWLYIDTDAAKLDWLQFYADYTNSVNIVLRETKDRQKWVKYTLRFTTKTGQDKTSLAFNAGQNPCNMYIDDLRLAEIQPGSASEIGTSGYCQDLINTLSDEAVSQVNTGRTAVIRTECRKSALLTFGISFESSKKSNSRVFLSFDGVNPITANVEGAQDAIFTNDGTKRRYSINLVSNSTGYLYIVIENNDNSLKLSDPMLFSPNALSTGMTLPQDEPYSRELSVNKNKSTLQKLATNEAQLQSIENENSSNAATNEGTSNESNVSNETANGAENATTPETGSSPVWPIALLALTLAATCLLLFKSAKGKEQAQ